ncbi:MAG: hypothetical protein K6C99_10270 [Lachnospiraceae bacterium]|nr:hypothetical protein [Lachnospiraceae bacterium]
MKEELIVINREASNIDNTYIELVDEDGDNIYDYYEKYFGTDPDKKDTDGDGLDDGAELFLLDTDPTDDDTDDDGIRDCDEDEDGDGLNILREHELRTSDLVDDYDLDKLNDGYEVNVTGTDPTLADTDFDGLMDIEELNLGLDPSKPDSDGNGIADRDELISQEVSRDYSGTALNRVSVDMMCAGILDDKLYIYLTYDKNSIVYDTAGLIGDPVEIYCDADFDTADITFRYDETLLGDTKEEDLCMVWYDEANDAFVILEDSVVDTVNNTVTYTTTHFSTYLLVDKVKYKKTFEDKEIDLTKIKNLRYYYVFVVDFTASEESVDEQLRAVKEIMKYIDSVEPYSNYIDDDFNLRQYTYSIPKYILVYGKPGGAGDTYSDMASGYLDCHFNLENFDKIIQHYRDIGKVGTNMYDADFGNAAYKGVCLNGATFRHYFFMGDKYNLNDTWKSKIDSQFKNQTSLGVFNTVTLNNYGYNCFDSYVSEKGKIYRAINGTDAVIEEIIRDLKNSGVGKDLSGISHFSAIHSKLKYENDSYYLCFDGGVSAEDQEKQASVAQALIEHMDENDVVSIIAYYNDGYEMDYHLDKVDAIEWITRFKEREVATASKLYNGNIPVVLNSRVFNELARDTKSYTDSNRNVKVFVFYAGNIYDSSIYEHLDKPYFSFDSKGINDSIKYAADNDVIINTIAISYPTSQYMDSLIPITGGKSYDDSKGVDMLIAEILNDLNEQKEIQKNKASEGSDQSKDISSEITVYLPNKFIGVEYLNVDGANGGNQNWWGTFSVYYEEDQDLLNYMVKRDLYDSADGYRTSEWGCGVMAMTDLELYLTQQNDGYHLMDQTFTYDTDSGNISQYEYMKCANYNRDNVYKLKPGLKNYIIGVTPFDMTDGIKKYLCENNSPYKNATWAPTNNKAGTIDKIETMISNGIPVVFSYYNTEVDLFMYPDSENAKMKTENIKFQRCDSHYMTIIGYTKYWDEVTNEYKYILKIESWGKIYYINYDKYAESLSYYSNILEIY